MDTIPSEIVQLFSESSREFMQKLVENQNESATKLKKKKTVLSKFKQSLDELLYLLTSTECQYVRCIKPNIHSSSHMFDDEYVASQLNACGVLETVRIRSQAHSVRVSYESFYRAYQILLKSTNRVKLMKSIDDDEDKENQPEIIHKKPTNVQTELKLACRNILLSANLEYDASFGRTMIFIRQVETIDKLDHIRQLTMESSAQCLQRFWRYFITKRQVERQLRCENEAASVITRALRSYKNLIHKKRKAAGRMAAVACTSMPVDVPNNEMYNVYASLIVYRRGGVVSTRHPPAVNLRIHTEISSLLKNVHCMSKSFLQCSLIDCLEDNLRDYYTRQSLR